MESYKIENLSFAYPNRENKTIDNINLTVKQGEFITLCGKSGCGKTTFLRLLKSSLSPYGNLSGNIYFKEKLLSECSVREQAAEIGFVMQSPDNQIVTDKVWHELAFGLESLGCKTPEIRTRAAEMASFFGIQNWFYKRVTELSGGQKQLLNLASVMIMQPSVLILDEPTSQLDPIAAGEFLKTLQKINQELGTTIILSEHRLEDAFPISDRVIVMDGGRFIADGKPSDIGKLLKEKKHDMYLALPTPMRVYGAVKNDFEYPVTVRDGRIWLENYVKENAVTPEKIPDDKFFSDTQDTLIEVKTAWFRYERNLPDVIRGLNLKIYRGEIFSILGGNGTGKTTALSLISALNTPYRGEVLIKGENISKINNLYDGILGVLPQNPQALFVKNTVYLDLLEMLSGEKISREEKEERIKNISLLCNIENLLDSHPYDLSGGEQQRTAMAKILLKSPEILLLDEPTKGMDAHFKEIFADILRDLKENGVTIVMVSHDIEFCAKNSDRCSMFFDGNITAVGTPRTFFSGNSFYTTSANRMAKTTFQKAVLDDDIVLGCGCEVKCKEKDGNAVISLSENKTERKTSNLHKNKRLSPKKITLGILFIILFFVTCILQKYMSTDWSKALIQIITLSELAGGFMCFFPQKKLGVEGIQQLKNSRKLSKRTLAAAIIILLVIPITIYIGKQYLGDRKYYFISLLIILETMIPFCMVFESRKPQARELVVISVLCAIAVAARAAFFMLPQFKPVVALVIIAGICFGGETGFLVGAVTGFVSNFFFGQGPWTTWQMFALGIIGFLAGVIFQKGILRKTKASLAIFGAVVTFLIYGGIMNASSVIMWQSKLSAEMFISSYISGIPFDLVHSASTVLFLWFISEPMIDKLERIKVKYGLIE